LKKAAKRAVETDPTTDAITAALNGAGFKSCEFVNWTVPENLLDRFAYSGKDNPGLYFEDGILDGYLCSPIWGIRMKLMQAERPSLPTSTAAGGTIYANSMIMT